MFYLVFSLFIKYQLVWQQFIFTPFKSLNNADTIIVGSQLQM